MLRYFFTLGYRSGVCLHFTRSLSIGNCPSCYAMITVFNIFKKPDYSYSILSHNRFSSGSFFKDFNPGIKVVYMMFNQANKVFISTL